uniref:Uncharacterized protein n=1 Tax=Chromera velia CCMP2878 TaxID=1169474 RepID=A0A0G4HZT4_9ALVE|eukprot:Cvel_9797.t1-p1 / transcript=Cvel_9797.t1 / gene=Cvel_9797 / organism=Chromera_velia_CCMP2878 / gene_product=hypothetical protein / transcript_product=hypothetical protein / location=Cvel_scaffold575:12533-13156(-) / protein_length=163 / sequence_SO=supercontig / SO=protein_coding / is_pseudo=false
MIRLSKTFCCIVLPYVDIPMEGVFSSLSREAQIAGVGGLKHPEYNRKVSLKVRHIAQDYLTGVRAMDQTFVATGRDHACAAEPMTRRMEGMGVGGGNRSVTSDLRSGGIMVERIEVSGEEEDEMDALMGAASVGATPMPAVVAAGGGRGRYWEEWDGQTQRQA